MKLNFAEIGKIAVNLILICLSVGFCLSFVNQITKAPIKANEMKETMEARKKILPAEEYVDLTDEKSPKKLDDAKIQELKDGGVSSLVKAVDKGKFLGYIVETSKYGYSSNIQVMFAVSPNFELLGATIKQSAETPGLGEKIKEPKFIDQFKDLAPDAILLKKDHPEKGNIVEVTGATISSRAVTEAINKSLNSLIKVLQGSAPAEKKTDKPVEEKELPGTEEPKPVEINFDPAGSKVYAAEVKIDPALKKILPADKYRQVIPDGFEAVKSGKVIGYVVKGTGKGVADNLTVGYSLDPSLKIMKVRILEHDETMDYIHKLEKEKFPEQFTGKTLKTLVLVKGEKESKEHISAVTGATVSSTGVFNAVKDSLTRLQAAVKK